MVKVVHGPSLERLDHMSENTSKVLVTGGLGFIGTNLIAKLLGRDVTVRVLDNRSKAVGSGDPGDQVNVLEGDVRDADMVARAVDGVQTVVHLAAAGSVIDSIARPLDNFDINARGTLTVLHAAAQAGVGKFVFASTGGAIMGNASPPVNERSLPWPISPYGASKLCGEAYCHAFAGSYGLDTVALRFANVYGPYSDLKKGAVTTFITSALRGEPLKIFGDGSASRDFLYVNDLCDGIVAAIDAPISDEIVHLASSTETTVAELAHLILDVAGRTDLPITYEPRRQGEVERNFANATRAGELLGFTPAFSLRRGMERTVAWFEANRDRWHAGA